MAFLLMHLAPGNPASIIAGDDASPDDVRAIERQRGLDRPLPIQLVQWYGRLLRGDLGSSIFLRKPVTEAISITDQALMMLALLGISIPNFL